MFVTKAMIASKRKTEDKVETTYIVMHGAKDINLRRETTFDNFDKALEFAQEESKKTHVNMYKKVTETKVTFTEI